MHSSEHQQSSADHSKTRWGKGKIVGGLVLSFMVVALGWSALYQNRQADAAGEN